MRQHHLIPLRFLLGPSYINYSQICARVVRQALKEPFKTAASGRDESTMKTAKWEAGKIVKQAQKIAQ